MIFHNIVLIIVKIFMNCQSIEEIHLAAITELDDRVNNLPIFLTMHLNCLIVNTLVLWPS